MYYLPGQLVTISIYEKKVDSMHRGPIFVKRQGRQIKAIKQRSMNIIKPITQHKTIKEIDFASFRIYCIKRIWFRKASGSQKTRAFYRKKSTTYVNQALVHSFWRCY